MKTPKWVFDDNEISFEAFMPYVSGKSWKEDRALVDLETSINWEDTNEVLQRTLGHQNGRFGAGRVRRDHVQGVGRFQHSAGCRLERKLDPDEPDNPHHGNILFSKGMSKGVVRAVANAIALDAKFVPPNSAGGGGDVR
jgi:hypothetical protein